VIILADGLRPDAITPSVMPALDALSREYTTALHATTVRPSSTVAALASLATGVAPESHGLIQPGLGFLKKLRMLRPVARELSRRGLPSRIVASELVPTERAVVWALAGAAGIGGFTSAGRHARGVALAAVQAAATQPDGVIFVYLNDCDQAGHAHGWMSRQYIDAAAELDVAIARLADFADDSLVILLADHGGGGITAREHHEPHPINDRIPLVLAGPGVTRCHQLTRRISLLDVPPTVLWSLGLDVPATYEGRVLTQAFATQPGTAQAAV
jgi:hypothetical protein